MPKGTLLKYLYFLCTVPAYVISSLFLTFNFLGFRDKLLKCILIIDLKSGEVPDLYVDYLISAEDHRSSYHYGIDQIGMLRAVYKKISKNETQGASTIEQQFVRVVTGEYSQTVVRKLKEQLLSVLILRKRNKKDIAKAYLAIAYYGYNYQGVDGIYKLVGSNLECASEQKIVSLVAHLKYPKPKSNFGKWEKNISNRVSYIQARHDKKLIGQSSELRK